MLIVVDLEDRSVALRQPDAFDRFSVEVTGEGSAAERVELAELVLGSGLGRVPPDGDHVVVDPDALRGLVTGVTAEWEAGFEGMCRYAAGKGWVEADGAIQAHIEWRGPG